MAQGKGRVAVADGAMVLFVQLQLVGRNMYAEPAVIERSLRTKKDSGRFKSAVKN